jgi:pimeloyl-ACP methyl ester carboxylesterase
MRVAEAGGGEPVLLLHGWPQHSYAWRDVIPLLARHYRVICPDLRGFGWTDAPRTGYSTGELVDDLIALLDILALERVFVIGHELGGRLGFHLSLSEPTRVRGHLALNALHPYGSARRLAPQAWRQWWTVFVETPLLGRTVLRRLPAFTRLLFRLGNPNPDARAASAVDQFVATLREPDRARAAERVQTQFAYRELVPTLLGKYRPTHLKVPTLMLNGTKDFALSPAGLGGYESYADDLRVELVTDAGHFLPEERPRLVAETAHRFFSSNRASVGEPGPVEGGNAMTLFLQVAARVRGSVYLIANALRQAAAARPACCARPKAPARPPLWPMARWQRPARNGPGLQAPQQQQPAQGDSAAIANLTIA